MAVDLHASFGQSSARALQWLQRRMLWLLLSTYVVGALLPQVGVAMRSVSAGVVRFPGGATTDASLPVFMLGFLLAVAGLATNVRQLKHIGRRPGLVIVGLAANTTWPIAFTVCAAIVLTLWSNDVEAESLLIGLAMSGAMPVAGASATWAQNANGNVALSLAIVLASTLVSPLVAPLVLHTVAAVIHGDYAEDLKELARGRSTAFVVLAIVLPSLFGIGLRGILGAERVARALPALKFLNLVDLLLLNYSNAAVALPQFVRVPNWNFVLLAFVLTACMCCGAFALGWWVAGRLRAEHRDRISLTFALGMSNNGSGLVLAASAFGGHPLVLLPIMLYNLVQQSGAGIVDAVLRRRAPPSGDRPRTSCRQPT
jgi:BASS family bile acid:Na+ symporter